MFPPLIDLFGTNHITNLFIVQSGHFDLIDLISDHKNLSPNETGQ